MSGDRLLLIYDGDCRFCRFGMEIVRNLDVRRVLDFCPFGQPAAERHLSSLPPDERYSSFHVASGDELHSGSDAARLTLLALPFGDIAVALGLHRTYPILARSRGILGRFVPDRVAVNTCGREEVASV